MAQEKQTHQLHFEEGCTIHYTAAVKAVASENDLFPILRRIAISQQNHSLQGISQQLWFFKQLNGGWLQAHIYNSQLAFVLGLATRDIVVAAAEVYLWYDDGVLKLPEED